MKFFTFSLGMKKMQKRLLLSLIIDGLMVCPFTQSCHLLQTSEKPVVDNMRWGEWKVSSTQHVKRNPS